MTINNFKQAFENNFYSSKEYANFCSKVTGIKINEKKMAGKNIYLLKNKNISLSNYSKKFCESLRKEKISYMAVLPEINNQAKKSSIIEYSIFHKKNYADTVKKYEKSFKRILKKSKKYLHEFKVLTNYDEKIILEIYEIYVKQMKKLNSFIFPKKFFQEFMKLKSSLLFIIEYEKKIMAYSFCFKNKDNLYASIGGGDSDFFKYKPINKLYDERIKYACKKNLNIHLGIGQKNSGYNKFKEDSGAINYKCERNPNDEFLLKIIMPFLKLKITGKILQILSKKYPEKIIYNAMPFT